MGWVPRYKCMLVREKRASVRISRLISPAAAFQFLKEWIGYGDREQLVLICMDARNQPIGIGDVSTGTLTASLVHPRELFKTAILLNSAGIIVAHNHPSGDPSPSAEDKATMKRIKDAGVLLGIPLLDFIIAAEDRHWSAKDQGLI